jgi:hypothetical protein
MSSKADYVVEALISRPLSAKQIQERREAETRYNQLIATPAGQIVERPSTPTEAPRPVNHIPVQTSD